MNLRTSIGAALLVIGMFLLAQVLRIADDMTAAITLAVAFALIVLAIALYSDPSDASSPPDGI
jgi:hypothetical protein